MDITRTPPSRLALGILLAGIFLWIGFVGAISFMEAWLKFRAPGVSLSVGLGIGKLVFHALNKVELVLMATIVLSLWKLRPQRRADYRVLVPVLILLIQVVFLMPILDQRADAHIRGQEVAASSVHLYYIIGEVVKMIFLWWSGIYTLRQLIR